ncbi:hypothetical protein IV102_23930 [bacterium]|nr:hypothetical protein [bacterium]
MKPKFLLLLSLAMMLTPSFLYWLGPLRRPAMTDGDVLKMMPCPVCAGSGLVQNQNCQRCRGKKQLQHVIPGPHRPTCIEGHVYAPDGSTVVPEASVTFSSEAGSWSRKTDEQGRFGADLVPGRYPVEIDSPRGKLKTFIVVAPQVTPSPVDIDWSFPLRRDAFTLKK